jgi:MFS transporter, FSR family, fosmidomycin resistance protein
VGLRAAISARNRVLISNGLVHAINDGYVAGIYPVLPLIADEFHASYSQAALVKLGLSGALGAFELPAALLAERVGEAVVLGAGTAGLALGFAGLGLVGALWQVVALATFGGLAAAGQHPLSSSLVAGAYDARGRGTAISTLNFTGDVGKAVVPLLFGWLAIAVGWRDAMLILGLAGLPLVGLFAVLSRRHSAPVPRHERSSHGSGWGILDKRRFAILSAIGILDSLVRGGTLTLLAFLLVRKGLDTPTTAAVFTVIFVAGAAGKFGCGPLGARFGAVGVVALTELATALAVLAFIPAPTALLFPLAAVFGFFLNGTSSVLYTSVSELVASDRQARGYALYYTLTLVASAIGPLAYGLVADGWGLEPAFFAMAASAALTVPLAPLLRRRRDPTNAPLREADAQ